MRSVGAAVALELRFDPVDGGAVAIGALTAIAELRQALYRGLVLLELEPADHRLDAFVVERRRQRRQRIGDRARGLLCLREQ